MYWGFENNIANFSYFIDYLWASFKLWLWNLCRNGIFYISNLFVSKDILLAKVSANESGQITAASGFVRTVMSALESTTNALFGGGILTVILTIATALSVTAILVKYGIVIFKTYFLNVDDQTAAPTTDFFKRIIYVLILCLLAPTIMINGLYLSTYMGIATGSQIIGDVNDTSEVAKNYYELITEFGRKNKGQGSDGDFGMTASTFCVTPYAEAISGKSYKNAIEKSNDCGKALKKGCKVYVDDTEYDAYEMFCMGNLPNGENITKNTRPDFYEMTIDGEKVTGYQRVGQFIIDSGASTRFAIPLGYGSGLLQFLSGIVGLLFGVVVIYMTAMRIVDLISAMLMMFYYAQAYISEVQSSAIGQFIKKICSIWLTQFFVITMYAIYLAHSMSADFSLANLCLNLALFQVARKAPNTINDIMSSSGANEVLGSLGAKARGALT